MPRPLYFYWSDVIPKDQIKNLNIKIEKNADQKNTDRPATMAAKTSMVKQIRYSIIKEDLAAALERVQFTNQQHYGFDLYPLVDTKVLNYNIYRAGTEYTWHVDMDKNAPFLDIKFTVLINLSETLSYLKVLRPKPQSLQSQDP